MPLAAVRGDSVVHEDSYGRTCIKVSLGTASAGEVGLTANCCCEGSYSLSRFTCLRHLAL